ncbi:MAG: flippase-like domain-containing protein [Prolixibacteraceae bacterium]|nr:flippase-like domain-containing protein [Prolixibacteraceae bacterium]NLX30106.1 flippase-like domain-containing protein [Bacteroidales bacterium]HNQ38202.1 lysylphosphatidylglycerol synthase transmembrane domain-containing protein [Prolixibacteraceae bacterium]HPJ78453.1 lysylphosphatidylglycerol synthase transmembrane domain-containing protein [Prolixibacteraceae bacterium]HRV89621.1 lysylphosphatidylglycerol synthase transmembrane domain-containing protein [Prolixibacteraceae bacterium]
MKKKVKATLKYLFFFAVGAGIFWLIYKDQDLAMMKKVLREDVNYFWVWVSLLIGILSHISRAVRWNLLIEPLGSKPGLFNTFLAVMTGYLMNLVIPRMGEISRCGVLARYEKISFARLIGTVVTERIIDVLMLLFMTLLALLAQSGYILSFLRQNPAVEQKVTDMITSPVLIGGLVATIILVVTLRKRLMRTRLYRKIGTTIDHLKEGIISFRHVRKKGAMVFHSFFIWIMYYLMLYTAFFAFDFTKGLSPLAGLTTFVMGSFGMLAPVQGGLGTWHFMTKESLALYGVSNENGIIFAFVAHTTMNLLLIILGLLSLMALPWANREK